MNEKIFLDDMNNENLDEEEEKNLDENNLDESDEKDDEIIDVSNFFNYQRAINSLIDYLNVAIDDTIGGFTRSDQVLFTHVNKKLILNAILEAGFYDFCKYRLAKVAESKAMESEETFMKMMEKVQGEIDLLAYLLVNTRLAHRSLNFDLFLSLLKGGLFVDIMETHEKIVKNMEDRAQQVNRSNIQENIKIDGSNLYI